MWKRLSQMLLPLIALGVGSAGCYTQMRPPAGALDSDRTYDDSYWSDPYYDYFAYSPRWEMYPGLPWWYADYSRPHPPHHYPGHSWDSYEETSGRHGWDRGPGSPLPPRAGGGIGGGVAGDVSPTAPAAPPETSDQTQDDKPRDTDRSKTGKSSERRPESSDSEKRRTGWGR